MDGMLPGLRNAKPARILKKKFIVLLNSCLLFLDNQAMISLQGNGRKRFMIDLKLIEKCFCKVLLNF